jgi:hypothetical protein
VPGADLRGKIDEQSPLGAATGATIESSVAVGSAESET